MRVTVLICNHNYSQYLATAIESAIKQTYNPLCICVIDDGSTDNSLEIAKSTLFPLGNAKEKTLPGGTILQTASDFRKHVLISLPTANGPSFARNIGIRATWDETDIYAILDADDENYSTKVEDCIKPFSDPAVGIVYADYDIFNIASRTLVREYKEPFDKLRLNQECIIHSGALIRKQALADVVEETGFYDNTMRTCEDFDLFTRITEKYIAVHIPKSLSFVRVHPNNSTTSVHRDIWMRNWRRIIEKTKARHAH